MTQEGIVPEGYDEEERYFHDKDVELLARLKARRDELDAFRKSRHADEAKRAHWMRCPKCGQQMEEIEMDGVMVDKCMSCQGVYFDKGELELLVEHRRGGILKRLFG